MRCDRTSFQKRLINPQPVEKSQTIGRDIDGAAKVGRLLPYFVHRHRDVVYILKTESSCKPGRACSYDDNLLQDEKSNWMSRGIETYLVDSGHFSDGIPNFLRGNFIHK